MSEQEKQSQIWSSEVPSEYANEFWDILEEPVFLYY